MRLFVSPGRRGRAVVQARAMAERCGIPVEERPARRLGEMTATSHHQGLVAEVSPTPMLSLAALLNLQPPDKPPLILLDRVQDPRNLGAILRTAATLGAGGAIWPKAGAPGVKPSVSKAAAGALEVMPLARVPNMARALSELKEAGYWVVAGDPEGECVLGQEEIPCPTALVLGAEGKGIRPLVRRNCDLGVRIAMKESIVNSLNVAVAAGLLLFAVMSGVGGKGHAKRGRAQGAEACEKIGGRLDKA